MQKKGYFCFLSVETNQEPKIVKYLKQCDNIVSLATTGSQRLKGSYFTLSVFLPLRQGFLCQNMNRSNKVNEPG